MIIRFIHLRTLQTHLYKDVKSLYYLSSDMIYHIECVNFIGVTTKYLISAKDYELECVLDD